MSWSVKNFFKISQAVKQPHFMHDNLSFKLQRNADLPLHLPRSMAGKNAELYKYNLIPRSVRQKLGNNPAYEVGRNIQDGGYSC